MKENQHKNFLNKLWMLCCQINCNCLDLSSNNFSRFAQRNRKSELRKDLLIINSYKKIDKFINQKLYENREKFKICKVIMPFEARLENELQLILNEELYFMGIHRLGWWKGWNGEKFGIFPSICVEMVLKEENLNSILKRKSSFEKSNNKRVNVETGRF